MLLHSSWSVTRVSRARPLEASVLSEGVRVGDSQANTVLKVTEIKTRQK